MSQEEEKKVKPGIYWLLTAAYLALVLLGAVLLGYFSTEGRHQMDPDEWGAVLGGVFSPLAFLWLIFASLSQREELELQRAQLKLQRKELELQRDELRRNSDAQIDQKDEMAAQVAALTAHTKLLEAQATAAYEPVFVVSSVDGMLDNDAILTLYIENAGCDVLEVSTQNNAKLATVISPKSGIHRSVRGGVVSHWPKGTKVQVEIDLRSLPSRDKATLCLKFSRLDTSARRVEFAIRDSGYRLALLQSDTTTAVSQTVSAHVPTP